MSWATGECGRRYGTDHRSKMTPSVELSPPWITSDVEMLTVLCWMPKCLNNLTLLQLWREQCSVMNGVRRKPFEVIKQRKVGRCMAVCQSSSRGQRGEGKHMIANGWWVWSCSQTNGQIKRVINTSGHKSKFAPASVYKLPTIKEEHLAYIWHCYSTQGPGSDMWRA